MKYLRRVVNYLRHSGSGGLGSDDGNGTRNASRASSCPTSPRSRNASAIDQRDDRRVQPDRVRPTRRTALGKRRDQRILGQLAVLVVFIGRPYPLHFAGNPVTVAISTPRQPHAAAQIVASDVAVLPDPQRRSTGQRTTSQRTRVSPCLLAGLP